MSYKNTKKALVKQLLTGIGKADIAFENKYFNAKGRDSWVACYFRPTLTNSTGKTLQSSDEQRGFFQVSVFINANNKDYDYAQLEIVDDILSAFQNTTSITFDNQTVDILESTLTPGSIDEPWFKRDITINYLTFSTR